MESLSLSIVLVIGISGLIFISVCIFFLVIFWQEFREFKDSPLIIASGSKPGAKAIGGNGTLPSGSLEVPKAGIYSKNKGRKVTRSGGTGSSRDSSLCSSTVTLEMSVADEYGSSDSIVKCSSSHGPSGSAAGSEPHKNVDHDYRSVCV